MLTLLTILSIIIMALCIILTVHFWGAVDEVIDALGVVGIIVFFIVSAICIGIWISELHTVATSDVIDQKIEMYEEENERIEASVSKVVEGYKDYESSTLKEFKTEDLTVAVAMIPELNSDSLVQNQIAILQSNNEKIKSLKEKKIDVEKSRWWLTFKTRSDSD